METLSSYLKSLNSNFEVIQLDRKKLKNPNGLILGVAGRGRGIHPWDNLKKCPKCGGYPWFVGKDGKDFDSGSPYRIICSNYNCDCQSIQSDNIELCRNDWNGKGICKITFILKL